MDFNYFLFILKQNINVFVFLLFLIFIYKLFKYITAEKIVLDMTKTKWNRDLTVEQMYNRKEDVPAENLTGWVPIFRSEELGKNQVKGTHFCGHDLLVFRSSSGKAYVLDAYCPHLGTYLPAGGKVVGESIRCPFHARTFNGKGECTIPGLNAPNLPNAKIKTWITKEVNELIMFWYDSNDEPPKWLPMENKEIKQLKLTSSFEMKCSGHFTDMMYNGGDLGHFNVIHAAPINVGPGSLFQQNLFFRLMTKILRFDLKPKFTLLAEKHRYELNLQILVYFLGKLIIRDIVFITVIDSPYLAHAKLFGGPLTFANLNMIITVVPISGRKFCFKMHMYSKPTLLAWIVSVLVLRFEGSQLKRDAAIFSGKKMLKKPYFCKLEKDLVDCTRWMNQFYPSDKKLTFQEQDE